MLEKTVFLNDNVIIKVLKEKYGININEVKKLNRGSANIYSLNDDKYILKEFQSRYSKEQIEKEIAVINHLKKKDIRVPEYMKCLDGNYSFVYKEKTMIVQKFIEGYTIDPNNGDYNQTMESAYYLGKIINGLDDIDYNLPTSDISSWYSKENFDNAINTYNYLLNNLNDKDEMYIKIKNDLEEKINMINDVKKKLKLDEMKNLTIKGTHGDYSVMQFIYKDGKINAIIDFVSACKMPVVWEIIRSYSYIDKNAKNGEFNIDILVDYVKEVCKYVNLNKYDFKYMPYLYMIQLLNSSYGYKQYLKNSNKDLLEFGFLRTNICRYLYKNATIISDRLISEFVTN